ncbi:MAG: hypothetical protein AB4040_03740, partial [Synechococcus sp.]
NCLTPSLYSIARSCWSHFNLGLNTWPRNPVLYSLEDLAGKVSMMARVFGVSSQHGRISQFK